STVLGCAEGALDTGATHRGSCRRTLCMIPPGGGKEPEEVPMGFPGGAEQREGLGGQGGVPGFGALTTMGMDLVALACDVRDVEEEGFMEPEAQALDGDAGDLVVQGCRRGEEPLTLRHTADGRETVCGLRTHE